MATTTPLGRGSPSVCAAASEVAGTLAPAQAVLALESMIIAHGLRRAAALDLAGRPEQTVSDCGAVPATIAVIDGEARVGLFDGERCRVVADESICTLGVVPHRPVVTHRVTRSLTT